MLAAFASPRCCCAGRKPPGRYRRHRGAPDARRVPANLGPIKCGLSALAAKWRMEEPAEEEQRRPVRVRGARSGHPHMGP